MKNPNIYTVAAFVSGAVLAAGSLLLVIACLCFGRAAFRYRRFYDELEDNENVGGRLGAVGSSFGKSFTGILRA